MTGSTGDTTAGSPGANRDRGQAAVIAVVLLVAIVAIGSIGILLLGSNANDQSKEKAQDERVRQSFVELDTDIDSVAASDRGTRRVDLDLPDEADVAIRREAAGKIVINRTNLTTTSTIVVKTIGAIVYENEDTHYAYQAGAVWRGEGNNTRMVSAPPIEYDTSRNGGDPTLTLPITDITGPDAINGGDLRVQKLGTRAPLNDVATIDNQLVTLKITSAYYVGWGRYFETRYDNAVVDYDHSSETVTIKLGKREIDGTWENGILTNGDIQVDNSADGVDGTIVTGGDYNDDNGDTECDADGDGVEDESGSQCTTENDDVELGVLDNAIAAKGRELAADCAGDSDCEVITSFNATAGAGYEFQGGKTYYVTKDSELDGTSVQADLSGGNITILTEGDVGLRQAEIEADNPDPAGMDDCCYLRIYFNGTDMSLANTWGVSASTDNATRVQLYGTSDFHLDAKNAQSGDGWHAALYAPGESGDPLSNHANNLDSALGVGCSYDICFGEGSGTIDGAIVAGSVKFGQNTGFNYDSDLSTVSPVLGFAGVIPPPITFLHVAVNKVCVNTAGNCPPAAGFTYSPASPSTGTSVSFDAATSVDDESIAEYQWDFDGDGTVDRTTTDPTVTHTYSSSGSYDVKLIVKDEAGATDAATRTVSVS